MPILWRKVSSTNVGKNVHIDLGANVYSARICRKEIEFLLNGTADKFFNAIEHSEIWLRFFFRLVLVSNQSWPAISDEIIEKSRFP